VPLTTPESLPGLLPRNRVVQVRRFGGPDGLEVVDAPLPLAGRGEVRVRVVASSLNYTDVLIRQPLCPQTAARRPPFVLGYDVVGEIDQLGDGMRDFQLGDRVADMTVIGSNATIARFGPTTVFACRPASTQRRRPLVRELGATPIDYQREDFTRILPGGFDVVFDGVGEDGYRRSFAALKRGGLLCAIGYSAGVQARHRMLTMLMWIARLYLWS
jgi:NADPH:quinone reductase